MSTSTAEQLGNWRVIGARRSEEAYESCIRALKAGGLGQEGKRLLIFRLSSSHDCRMVRQRAARDRRIGLGSIKSGSGQSARQSSMSACNILSQAQIDVLNKRFPKSPRVMVLRGMLLEVKGDIERATQLYGSLIQKDETNVVSRPQLSGCEEAHCLPRPPINDSSPSLSRLLPQPSLLCSDISISSIPTQMPGLYLRTCMRSSDFTLSP